MYGYLLAEVDIANISVQPAYQQEGLSSVIRLPFQTHPPNFGLRGSVVCLSDDHLIFLGLDELEKEVPRHMVIGGTPRRILYSWHLDLLVVTYSKLSGNVMDTHQSNDQQQPIREIVSSVKLIDLNK